MSQQEIVIQLDDVSVRYRVPKEQIRTFKEYAIRQLQDQMQFNEFWALRNVNLTVYKGEVLGIIGRNGAGKSTLLKVIARVLFPTEGRVRIKGDVAPLLELGAGFDQELTGRENIFLNGAILGRTKKNLEENFDRIVGFAGLRPFIDAPLRTYSTGMIARLGFSVATDIQPEVLIVDEILGVGDLVFQKRSSDRITQFCDSGSTVLMVSHGMDAVQRMCDRVVWLDQGKVRAMGEAGDVIRLYQDDSLNPFLGDKIIEKWETPEKLEEARKTGDVFDEVYFKNCCGQPYERTPTWLRMFNHWATMVVDRLAPEKVMDAGCGKGFMVEALRDRGVAAYGVDISSYAIADVREDMHPYVKRQSITQPFEDHYDLVVCIEVLQNLQEEEGVIAVENMCRSSDQVILSVSAVDYRSPTYVNVKPLSYWEGLFARFGFVKDESIDVTFITPWTMRFVRSASKR